MRVASLMSGTQGEEAHQAYKEENRMENIEVILIIDFVLVLYDFLHASVV